MSLRGDMAVIICLSMKENPSSCPQLRMTLSQISFANIKDLGFLGIIGCSTGAGNKRSGTGKALWFISALESKHLLRKSTISVKMVAWLGVIFKSKQAAQNHRFQDTTSQKL